MHQEQVEILDQEIGCTEMEVIEKQKKQIQSENQKLINYIKNTREGKKKKSLWDKIFYK